jgi:hypothetical protein
MGVPSGTAPYSLSLLAGTRPSAVVLASVASGRPCRMRCSSAGRAILSKSTGPKLLSTQEAAARESHSAAA